MVKMNIDYQKIQTYVTNKIYEVELFLEFVYNSSQVV